MSLNKAWSSKKIVSYFGQNFGPNFWAKYILIGFWSIKRVFKAKNSIENSPGMT